MTSGTTDSSLPPLVMPGPSTSVSERLEEVARHLGDKVAVESADGRLTFRELVDRVDALAAEIAPLLRDMRDTDNGDTPVRRPVGLFAEQGTDSVAAMLAVMKCGHPCVALDSVLPDARVSQIAELADVGMILTDAPRREIAASFPGSPIVRGLLPEGSAPATPVDLPPPSQDDVISLVFTSGTTGKPKGVVWTNHTLLSISYTARDTIGFNPDDRVSMIMPQAFAAGQMLIFAGLLNGASLCVRDPRVHGIKDMTEWLRAMDVTTLHLTPALLRALQDELPEGTVLESVRVVTTAGDKVYGKDVDSFRPYVSPDAVFVNWLGSSETEALTYFKIGPGDPVPEGVVPAGRTVILRELSIRTLEGEPLPAGEAGVLHCTSAHMSVGYWKDPEGTAAVFTPLEDGRTTFRTGDRATLTEDGMLHLLGRADDAVKIRGYLVEPGEVESVLRKFPEIADVAVRAIPGRDEEKRLVAWVVPDPHHTSTPSPASVRSTLSRLLPAYMVPGDVVMLTAIPRNERGKVVAAELPAPPTRPEPTPPATDGEAAMQRIWAPILRLDSVGRDESFTALGGDSLAVEEMLAGVEAQFGVSLTTADLAEHPSLAEFTELAESGRESGSVVRADTLVRLHPAGTAAPLFCFAGAGGAAALFEVLAEAMGPDQPVYAFQVNGFENPGMPDWTVGRAARRYARIIQQVAPEGPVVLAGHSLGGLFALRVARLLGEQGREVALVGLLDTILPPAARGGEEDGRWSKARLRRRRPVLVAAALYEFLLPTTLRRRRNARREAAEGLTRPEDSIRPQRSYLRTRLRILGAGFGKYDYAERKDIFNLHGIGIAQFHRPRPWHGRALVFYSDENRDPHSWWDVLLPGPHEFITIEASHVAVLKWPYVEQIAGPLITAMEELGLRRPATATR
ncbi:alpha/beta fold hydrolase [Blastococcus sp. CT_GayMR20]|uniref:alpha/beta fold hydrolase n=1 Tax=Blastococcus sp. CT_GayMR20 TaxID=2559609 RepID=UPI001430A094|nr:alpha/beta fold hydrolase [Blastococcus sp. CT_GayMR20]